MYHFIVIIIFYISCSFFSFKADAAACCTSATAFGTGRLLIWEKFALGLSSSLIHQLGDFDPKQKFWQLEKSEYISRQWFSEIWGIVGIHKRFSIFGSIPFVVPIITQHGISDYGYGFGDIKSGLRYQLVHIGEYQELPAIALLGTLVFPTGTGPGTTVEATNITGRGAWALALGSSIEKTWMPWYAQLNIGTTIFFKNMSSQNPFWYGPSTLINIASGVELPKNFVLSLIGQWNYEGNWYQAGKPLFEFSRYKGTLILAASWRFHPHLTVQSSLSSDIPLETISYGLPGNVGFTIGIRYGYF